VFVAALIILIIAVLLVIAALFGGNDQTVIDMGAFDVEGPASLVFFAGMVTLLLFVLSLGLFRAAAKRAAARRSDRRKVSELSDKLDAYKRDERDSHDDIARDER
jgi:membrane protein implicated in regulation of membrane protease activity